MNIFVKPFDEVQQFVQHRVDIANLKLEIKLTQKAIDIATDHLTGLKVDLDKLENS